jgi:hypothetical protein
MRASWFAALLLVAGALAAPLTLRAQEQAYVVRPTADPCLNVRPSPDTDVEAFACISVGSQVTGIGTAPYWRRIRLTDGRTGWAAKKYLEPAAVPAAPSPGEIGNPNERDDAWLEVHIIDVGQGDGV